LVLLSEEELHLLELILY